jgi:hypothetical protein
MKRLVFDLTCSIEGVTIHDLNRDAVVKVDVVEGTIMYFKAYIKDMYAPIKVNINTVEGDEFMLFMSQKH